MSSSPSVPTAGSGTPTTSHRAVATQEVVGAMEAPPRLLHARFPRRGDQMAEIIVDWLAEQPGRFHGNLEFAHALKLFADGTNSLGVTADHLRTEWYPPGSFIIEQGEAATELVCILSGDADVAYESCDGQLKKVHSAGPGSFVGEEGLGPDRLRTANVIARDTVTCLVLSRERPSTSAGRGQHGRRAVGDVGTRTRRGPRGRRRRLPRRRRDAGARPQGGGPLPRTGRSTRSRRTSSRRSCSPACSEGSGSLSLLLEPRSATRDAYDEAGLGRAEAAFTARFPSFDPDGRLAALRRAEYGRLDAEGQVYLDYTGGGLHAASQIEAHADRLCRRVLGNPHSNSPTSSASTELVERTRRRVLDFFNAPPDEYLCIFTPNASGALRLVGESYPFAPGGTFALTFDNHNSVNGIREFARRKGAAIEYVPVVAPELRLDRAAMTRVLAAARPGARNLLAFPAQSNFSGVQHPLDLVAEAHGARVGRPARRRRVRPHEPARHRRACDPTSPRSPSTR